MPRAKVKTVKSTPQRGQNSKEEGSGLARFLAKVDHVHGVSEWKSSTTKRAKVTWTVVLMLALSALLVEVVLLTRGFFSNPIATNYRLVNHADGMELPELFICPSNPVMEKIKTSSRIDSDWLNAHIDGFFDRHSTFSGLDGLLAANAKLSEAAASSRPPPAEKNCRKDNLCKEPPALYIPNNIQEYFMRTGYKLENMFKECTFKSLPIACTSIVTAYFDGDYGKCFHIHVPTKQTVDGVGLSVVLDLDFADAYPRDRRALPMFDGVTMKLSNFSNPLTSQVVKLPAGAINTVSLHSSCTEMISHLNVDPFKDPNKAYCVDDDDHPINFKVLNTEYSPLACIMDCHQQIAIDHCRCFLPIDRKYLKLKAAYKDIDLCTRRDFDECLTKRQQLEKEWLAACTTKCRSSCLTWTYQPEITSVRFPSQYTRSTVAALSSAEKKQDYRSICHHPIGGRLKVDGEISSDNTLWAYDLERKDCIRFEKTSGNDKETPNSFRTRNGCLNTCAYGNRCLAKGEVSNQCRDIETERYFYAIEGKECLRFYFYGCDGTANHFKTQTECENECYGLRKNKCIVRKEDVTIVKRGVRWTFRDREKPRQCSKEKWAIRDCEEDTPNSFSSRYACEVACHRRIEDKTMLIINDTTRKSSSGNDLACISANNPYPISNCTRRSKYYYNIDEGTCDVISVGETIATRDYFFDSSTQCEHECGVKEYVMPPNWNGLPAYLAPFPTDDISGSPLAAYDTEKLKRGDLLVLHIAYSSLQCLEMAQSDSVTFSKFVSNLGGQMGLWLGCSIISVLKIASLIIPAITSCCQLFVAKITNMYREIRDVV